MKLAELFVEFSTKGLSGVQSAIGAVSKSVLGFATAGLIGTTEGNHLLMVTKEFAHEVAAVFLPAIRAATTVIMAATEWMRNLSGAQQDGLQMWGLTIFAAGIAAKAFTLLGIQIGFATGGLSILLGAFAVFVAHSDKAQSAFGRIADALAPVFDALSPIFTLFEMLGSLLEDVVIFALEKIAAVVGGIAGVIVDLLAAVGLRGGGGKGGGVKGAGHRSVTRTSGGMEGTADSYKRVQQAALAHDINYPKKQTEHLADIAKNTSETNNRIARLQPGVVS